MLNGSGLQIQTNGTVSNIRGVGYWHLWHFNPAEEDEGKNGFHLDSKEPDWSKFRDFIMGEVRYNSLMKTFPQEAEELFVATERNAKLRYEGYKKLSEM